MVSGSPTDKLPTQEIVAVNLSLACMALLDPATPAWPKKCRNANAHRTCTCGY